MKISEKNLKKNGWEADDYDFNRFNMPVSYRKEFYCNDKTFYCELKNYSNTLGRDWYVHVDNDCCNSVGSMDVSTYDQIDRFLQLLSE